jgi:hypothetical protein
VKSVQEVSRDFDRHDPLRELDRPGTSSVLPAPVESASAWTLIIPSWAPFPGGGPETDWRCFSEDVELMLTRAFPTNCGESRGRHQIGMIGAMQLSR